MSFENVHCWIIHTTIKMSNISISPINAPVLLCCQATTKLATDVLCIFPFLEFYINRIIKCAFFCFCIFFIQCAILKFIYISICISTFFLFITELYFIVWIFDKFFIRSPIDEQLSFCLLLQKTMNIEFMPLWEQVFSFLLNIQEWDCWTIYYMYI